MTAKVSHQDATTYVENAYEYHREQAERYAEHGYTRDDRISAKRHESLATRCKLALVALTDLETTTETCRFIDRTVCERVNGA